MNKHSFGILLRSSEDFELNFLQWVIVPEKSPPIHLEIAFPRYTLSIGFQEIALVLLCNSTIDQLCGPRIVAYFVHAFMSSDVKSQFSKWYCNCINDLATYILLQISFWINDECLRQHVLGGNFWFFQLLLPV